jgi:hypothetical protein
MTGVHPLLRFENCHSPLTEMSGLHRPVERYGEEEAQRRNGAVDRGRLYPALALVHLKPANILSLRCIVRPPEERCEAAHKANLVVLCM